MANIYWQESPKPGQILIPIRTWGEEMSDKPKAPHVYGASVSFTEEELMKEPEGGYARGNDLSSFWDVDDSEEVKRLHSERASLALENSQLKAENEELKRCLKEVKRAEE